MVDDRTTFRAHAARLTIYPDGVADEVISASDDPLWAFFLVFGSTARGDARGISDIDLYAEPLGNADPTWVAHLRDRMRAHNVDLLVPLDGSRLADRLAAGEEFAKQLLREALVLSDHAGVIPGLRDRYR